MEDPPPTAVESDKPQSSPPAAPPKWQFWKKPKPPVDQENPKYPPVAYWHLFRYASRRDKIMITFSLLAAMAHGTLLPILTIIFGQVIDDFGSVICRSDANDGPPDLSGVTGVLGSTVNWFIYVAIIAFVLSFLQLTFALIAANRMGNDLRRLFFESLLGQDCDFYDDSEVGSLTHIVISDIQLIQGGIGDKLATAVQYITTFIVGIIVGFRYGWQLTLLVLGVTPVLLISGAVFGNASADATGDGLGAYGEAGGVASEVLSLIRTVTAFGGQEEEAKRYEKSLNKASKAAVKAAVNSGLGLGSAMLLILCTYGLAFWVGSILVRNGKMTVGDVLLTFFSITLGASSLGTAGPAFKSFGVARAAAPRVFEIIERASSIDPMSDEDGLIPIEPSSGRISFEDVDFNYAKRIVEDGQSELVLNKFNLEIPAGASEAFVGKSGCGKSTVARLIQRFYDPLSGSIKLDGVDVRELNVRWLRSQIGVVAQTPSLFMLSIRENIALGAGLEFSTDKNTGKVTISRRQVSDEDIIAAAEMANAHGFISKLPEGYNTMLGERGAMLSGGQKQRVCIARALVRNPKVLLLDESTASLDTASERIVQDALEKASAGRTTVTIAHRLSTVRNSDKISCIEAGQVVERGSHDDLISREGGFYKGLFELQTIERQKLEKEKTYDVQDEEEDKKLPSAPALPNISKTGVDTTSIHLEQGDTHDDQRPAIDKGLFIRTMKLNRGEFFLIFIGVCGAALAGVVWPLAAISLTELIDIMTCTNDAGDVRFWSLSFVVLGALAFVGNGLQHSVLGVTGERLTRRLRIQSLRALFKQEIGYFDLPENSVGALAGRLSGDAGAVKGLTGDLFGIGINLAAALLSGLIIAFVNCWRLTLVVLAIIPGIALGGYFEMQASAGIDSGTRGDFASANAVAAEAVDNIGTVRTLGLEPFWLERYIGMIRGTRRAKLRKALITGTAFGFSEFCQFLIWYATFKAGGDFVAQGHCEFSEMLLSSMAILFAAITLGNVSVFAPDVGASKLGATHVYRLLDRESQIDPAANSGEDLDHVEGDLAAKKVYFEYPRRPDVPVLRGLTLDISRSKTLALVGTSGHGKSTIISLLERFYTIREGKITVDANDISEVKVQALRSHIGLVSQEPELFNRSVFDNIAYGAPHNDGTPITKEDVVEAAKQANAHDFIQALPKGYDTVVGPRGDAISGGQRQRVAIARSLIRRPPVLLLDEATSALDSVSEGLVQEALDRASSGRTTIIVAHRLSTVRNADTIMVVRKGKIVEAGTHEVLLRKNGYYADLICHQLTDV